MLSFNFLNDPFHNFLHLQLMNDQGENPRANMPFQFSISFLFFNIVEFKPEKGTSDDPSAIPSHPLDPDHTKGYQASPLAARIPN
jgi:hypothetical protein